MSKMFDHISEADRKMLNKIYWRSFMVFAGPCGAAYRQASGLYNVDHAGFGTLLSGTGKTCGSDAAAYDALQHYAECRYVCDGLGRFDGT